MLCVACYGAITPQDPISKRLTSEGHYGCKIMLVIVRGTKLLSELQACAHGKGTDTEKHGQERETIH